MAGLGEELLRRGGIVPVVARALAQLVDGDGPLLEGRGHRGVHDAYAFDVASTMAWRSMAMDMARRTRTSLNGGLVGAHEMWLITLAGNSAVCSRGRFCLSMSLICTQSDAVDRARELPADVVLAGEECGHARGIVLVHEDLDPVDVGQAGHEVARVAHERHADIGPIRIEHPGPGADGRLGPLRSPNFSTHSLATMARPSGWRACRGTRRRAPSA